MKFLALLFIATSVFAQSIAPNKIYGGSFDKTNSWETTVAIAMGSNVFCTGSIVEHNIVLTAAHCVRGRADMLESSGNVLFGNGKLFGGWVNSIRVSKALMHPEYNRGSYNRHDFAILELKESVPSSLKIIPVLKPEEADAFYARNHISIIHVGYGQRENGASGKKYFVESEITRVFEAEFEAGLGDGRGGCFGDSGGPTFARLSNGDLRQIGVTSRGQSNSSGGCQTVGGMYGRADDAYKWYQTLNKTRAIHIK